MLKLIKQWFTAWLFTIQHPVIVSGVSTYSKRSVVYKLNPTNNIEEGLILWSENAILEFSMIGCTHTEYVQFYSLIHELETMIKNKELVTYRNGQVINGGKICGSWDYWEYNHQWIELSLRTKLF